MKTEIVMLWHQGFYDGPLNGVAEYQGRKVWFQLVDYEEDHWFYDIYELSDDDIKVLIERHELFQTLVGFHTDHLPGVYAEYQNNETTHDFYVISDKWEQSVPYTDNKKLTTLSENQFQFIKFKR